MLRIIEKPIVYFAGPEVFNTERDDRAFAEEWGRKHGFDVRHPRRHSHLPPKEIYKNCVEDARGCHVIVADVNDFRGKCMDDGTAVELGMAERSGAVRLGHKEKKEDPLIKYGPAKKKGELFVDKKGYFIDPYYDRNLMVAESCHSIFYGKREQTLEQIATYIDNKVKGWYVHEDPIIGRKLLPPNAKEAFESITPNFEVDVTRFKAIVDHQEMRRHREVKQLCALYLKYPGATHTRYELSLLTYKYTYDMLGHIRLSEEEKRHILAYSLMHDIGHTPYSHELEEITKLDQMEAAREIISEESFRKALEACDINFDTLLTFFDKKNPNPLRAIVSDKVLGTDKLAYLLRDGMATGKGGYGDIDRIIEHTVYEDGKLGIDEQGAVNALDQIWLYHSTYANIYFCADARINQRIFTLLGQIGLESGTLPKNWYKLNDLWYDYHNIRAEEQGHTGLKKLGRDGIVKQSYVCIGSLRLPEAKILEESGHYVGDISEEEYVRFLTRIPIEERKALEEKLCAVAGVEPLDILVSNGGKLTKLNIDDTLVFRKKGESVRLLADMYPEPKRTFEHEARRHAVSIRFYTRKECEEKVTKKLPELIENFRKLIPT